MQFSQQVERSCQRAGALVHMDHRLQGICISWAWHWGLLEQSRVENNDVVEGWVFHVEWSGHEQFGIE